MPDRARVLFARCTDNDLHRRARIEAAFQDMTLSAYVLRAVEFVVEWDEFERKAKEGANGKV